MNHNLNARATLCRVALLTLIALLAASCGGGGNEFRLKGSVKYLREGDLFLLSSTRFDTIHVRDYKFKYSCRMKGKETVKILFPNFQQLPLVAGGGISLKMKADARNFLQATVRGDEENEDLSAFYRENGGLSVRKQQRAAAAFIRSHPASMASEALLRVCFLESDGELPDETVPLLKILRKQQPQSVSLRHLELQTQDAMATMEGMRVPSFAVQTLSGDTVTAKQFHGTPLLICFWSDWQYDCRPFLLEVRRLKKQYGERLATLCVSLDTDLKRVRNIVRRDSIPQPQVCDTRAFASPLVKTFAVRYLPYAILINRRGRVQKRGVALSELGDLLNASS